MRIAAVGDLHARSTSKGMFHKIVEDVSRNADVLVLCGDLTDSGQLVEAEVLAEEFSSITIPVLAVLGNHDFEHGLQEEVKHILEGAKISFLESRPIEIQNVGFAGIKGFGGGFDEHMLQPWGEEVIKHFAQEAVNEAMRLEGALAKLRTEHKVVVLHYSPIRQTVEGEPKEIYPYLGSTRIVHPIDQFNVSVVFHGHAHSGMHEGKTATGTPVFNVSLPLLRRLHPEQPYIVINL